MKKKVLIPTKLDSIARELLEKNGNYTVVQEEKTDLAALAKQHPDSHALIVRSEKVTKEIIDTLPSLKVVMRAGSGYNTIDTKYARKKGVDVMTTPGANANAVAEEVIALMLADARHLVEADPSCRKGEWEKTRFMGREITGKTIGIVGLGYIGKLVAKRLSGFEMTLLGHDPIISEERARQMGIHLVDLPTLFERCDYITLHIPENSETKGLIDASLISKMKKNATLINCARAGVIHEEDMRKLKGGKGIRFLNDVYPKDEPGPKSVIDIADIMVPHLGASTYEANSMAAKRAAEELIEFDEKGITSYIVNRDIPEGLDAIYGELAFLLTKLCRLIVGKDTKLKQVETSFYGKLKPFADWLIVPITAALSDTFDRSSDSKAARSFLKDMGLELNDRETDESKRYGNSITVDLIGGVDQNVLHSASVRGTVAEGTIMISRINDFHKLYFEPKGHTVIFLYKDRPGVLGRIGGALAKAGVNIDDVRNPHDTTGEKSIAIVKVNKAVPDGVIHNIAKEIEAQSAFYVEL
jgi:D-3-phosphoglycerate dehydrogenase / 2-oxoglutarate reductase